MKSSLRLSALAGLLLASSVASAQFSANLGFASDYFFRGIFQSSSSASGGLDYENSGFYIGTWAANVGRGWPEELDVPEGIEYDLYFGYGGEFEDFSYGIGYTGYFYTNDYDDTYQEINLSGGYDILSAEVAVGRYDNFDGPTQDYVYYAIMLEHSGFYGKYAGFSQDFSGEYFEVGYGATVAEIDLGISLLVNDKDLNVFDSTSSDKTLIFTIGKSFDL